MKIYERLKSGFINKEYYISISNNYIYIMNYKSIISFDNKYIKIAFNNFILHIHGNDFKIKRKSKFEIVIDGYFSSMEISNEI